MDGFQTIDPGNSVVKPQRSPRTSLLEVPGSPPLLSEFQDVPHGDPFYGYIETAHTHNIISGYSCGSGCLVFRPGNSATRGQICKIVYLAVTSGPPATRP